jgi:Sulfotransferase family
LCAQLAVVWSLIEGAPLSADRGAAPPRVPDAAVAGIRRMVDEMTGSYLVRRGKRVFCDKSLGSARSADLLVQVYPAARFVCLYRHPMDVIRSGLDACPWGLNGYGFDQYIVGSPGNAVLALARYWLDNATAIAAAEEAHPGRCHRVRYEDLVADPEGVMAGVYGFIGVGAAPGVARGCFSGERERFGPGDHKIWATSGISAGSVGSGESVPAAMIVPQVAAQVNELAARLGYLPVDGEWGTPGRPADPRAPGTITSPPPSPDRPAASPAGPAAPSPGTAPRGGLTAGPPGGGAAGAPGPGVPQEVLRSRLERLDGQFASRWQSCARETFLVVSRTAAGGRETRWLVDLAARTITADGGGQAGDDEQADAGRQAGDATWSILGSPQAWHAVAGGQLNLHTALRRCDLRYCTTGEDSPLLTQTRVAMLADLLGISSWPQADRARPGTARRDTAAPAATAP